MANVPLSDCSDEDLLDLFRRGRQEGLAALVRRYEGELYGYLRRYLGDASLADDVFQNTFLQVFRKAAQFEAGRPVRPWLYTIATNQAIDALRRQGRRQAVSLDQEREEATDAELPQLLSLLVSREPGPAEHLHGAERRQLVRAGVERLPEFLKQVVLLAYYQGMKYRDVAEVLGIPVGTVKSRLHAALVKLQEAWADSPALRDE